MFGRIVHFSPSRNSKLSWAKLLSRLWRLVCPPWASRDHDALRREIPIAACVAWARNWIKPLPRQAEELVFYGLTLPPVWRKRVGGDAALYRRSTGRRTPGRWGSFAGLSLFCIMRKSAAWRRGVNRRPPPRWSRSLARW